MKWLHKSRQLRIWVATTSVLFVLWLSVTMWINAFDQHALVHDFKQINAQEEVLFELADALAAERRQMYVTYSNNHVDQQALKQFRGLAAETDAIVVSNEAELMSMQVTARQRHDSGHGEGHEHHTPETAALLHVSKSEAADEDVSVSSIIRLLRKDEDRLYQQLLLDGRDRDAKFGLMKMQQYSVTIESINSLRHALHTTGNHGLSEHFVITKLKDTFWNVRESVAQMAVLLEGIDAASKSSIGVSKTSHDAEMLMELNVRIEVYWTTLYATIMSSDTASMVEFANIANAWYEQNFQSENSSFKTVADYNDTSLGELQARLAATRQLSHFSEKMRTQLTAMTVALINDVEVRTTWNLIKVSILVLSSLFVAVASLMFFRRVDRQAHQDELTGLDNRRMFSITLEKCLAESKASGQDTGILMIDLDKFKYVNDTMGHVIGDRLLKEVSQRIHEVGSDCLSVSRLGGDEFALLFQGASTSLMEKVAGEVRQKLIDPFCIDGAKLNIGSSIGLAQAPRDADTADTLLQAADLAMYCAKKSGTNQISAYDNQVDQSIALAAQTVSELHRALLNNEFELYYQPQFNLAHASVLSTEALIRWNHPERGLLTPYHFISIAEENGLMSAIGDWVINEACRQAAYWLHEKNMPLRVAVNISADHFFQPDFVKNIKNSLIRHNLPPQLLEVEVTESVAMSDIGMVVASLQELRDLSIHVALDDFGTGYSSLSYLQELPLDTLKIDKSFIQNMLQGNVQKESITQTIVALGKLLDLETVAEGVETVDQLTAVSDMSISVVQGYYYSKPVTAAEIELVVQQLNGMVRQQKSA